MAYTTITESLRALLAGPADPVSGGGTGAEALALTAYRAALKGNDKYFKLIREMTEGTECPDGAVVFEFSGVNGYEK